MEQDAGCEVERNMKGSHHILVVDDDREIRDLLRRFLRKHGFRVTVARDGSEMRQVLETGRFDLIVLDLMLPGEDGLALCRWVRRTSNLPVIMLTAIGEETDRIIGLEMGADDYLPKPFSARELLARLRAVLRRAEAEGPRRGAESVRSLTFDGWKLDTARRELHRPDGGLVPLTTGEYDLLLALAKRPKRVLSRDQLLDLTRGRDAIPFDRSIDVQVSRLRRKIEDDPLEPARIKTVRGGGYVFAPEVGEV